MKVRVTNRGVPYVYPSTGGPLYASSPERANALIEAGKALAKWWEENPDNEVRHEDGNPPRKGHF